MNTQAIRQYFNLRRQYQIEKEEHKVILASLDKRERKIRKLSLGMQYTGFAIIITGAIHYIVTRPIEVVTSGNISTSLTYFILAFMMGVCLSYFGILIANGMLQNKVAQLIKKWEE